MNASVDDIRADIAFLKSLAEDGGSPRSGGAVIALAGACFGAASLAHYAAVQGYVPIADWGFAALWFGVSAVFGVGVGLINRGQSNAGSAATRAMRELWRAVGWCIFAIVLALMVAGIVSGQWIVMGALPPVIISLYGAAWMVGSKFSKISWIGIVPWVCFACATGCAALIGRAELYLAYAGALALTMLLPGLALMRRG